MGSERPDGAGVLRALVAVGRLASRLAALGARPVDRARLFGSTFVLLLAAKLGAGARLRLTVTIRAFGRTGRCTVGHFSHLSVLEAIFLDGDYAIEPLREPETIVDLGSNVGLSILYFRLRFPQARIVGVEPDPAAFALLVRNTERLPGVSVRHAAISDRDGTTLLWSAPSAVASALEHTHGAQRPVEVPARTLARVLADAGVGEVDILKLVVEGSEFRALESLDDLGRVGVITGEIVFVDGDPRRSAAALRDLLADFEVSLDEDKGNGFWQFHARRIRGVDRNP